MIVVCPNPGCGQKYTVREFRAGHTAVCKRCGRTFAVGEGVGDTMMASEARDTQGAGQAAKPADLGEKVPGRLGRFEVRSRLGAGAFGSVYRAYDPVLDREVALKVPRAAALENPEARARFLREPKAAAHLRHPNIVPVFEAGNDGDRYYIASAYIEGRTLQRAIEGGQIEFRQSAQIVRDLAGALDYAHRSGVVHRDVKPANIMIDEKGQPLLMDFGLARVADTEEKLTHDGAVMGTPAYMAPEQVDKQMGEVGPASDQYGLGVVLYELLCGETPFSGPPSVLLYNTVRTAPRSPRAKNPAVPRDLETICLRAMGKRPADRYATCQEMAEDMRRWLDDEPIRARHMGVIERSLKWAKRNPALAALAFAVLLLAVVSTVSALGILQSRQQLARALESETEQARIAEAQTDIARTQTKKAEEQTSLAQEKERLSQEKERVAQEALTNLKRETEARSVAEAERAAEAQKRAQGEEELKKSESQLEKTATALDTAKKDIESAESGRAKAVESSAWLSYIEHLVAADKACKAKDFAAARKHLDACPEEHRSFEWTCVDFLARGQSPVATSVPEDLGSLTVNRDVTWCCANPADSGVAVVRRLPDFIQTRNVHVRAKGPLFGYSISPDGRILVERTGGNTHAYDTETGKRIASLVSVTPLVANPVSADGLWFLGSRDKNGHARLVRTDTWQVVDSIDTTTIGSAFDFDGRTLSFTSSSSSTHVVIRSVNCDQTTGELRTWSIPIGESRSPLGNDLVMAPDYRWGAFGIREMYSQKRRTRWLVLDLRAKRVSLEVKNGDEVVSFSPDGKRLLVKTSLDYQIRCLPNGEVVPTLDSVPALLRGMSLDQPTTYGTRTSPGRVHRTLVYAGTFFAINPRWTRMVWSKSDSIHCWSIDEEDLKKHVKKQNDSATPNRKEQP